MQDDECCGPRISAALLADQATMEAVGMWDCPECETRWKPVLFRMDNGEGVLHWEPQVECLIFSLKRF